LDCSGVGIFQEKNYTCTCNPFYYGLNCEFKKCPNNCKSNGVCDVKTGKCSCNSGYKGFDCSVSKCNNI